MAKTFEFQPDEDGSLSPQAAIYQAVGAASMCWEDLSGAGVFDDAQARAIADALIDVLGVQA